MIYCFDIDNTLCISVEDDYAHSTPLKEAIRRVNKLYDDGHIIKLFTARGSWDNYDWREFTERQLASWGVKYHELILNKPHFDVLVDDKALNAEDWLASFSEKVKEVERDWGKEVWLVNCDEYCGKLLYLPKGAISEYHYHKDKKETFYCLRGHITLRLEEREIILDSLSLPITIKPGQRHSFYGNTNSLILEISTHHSDEDSVLLTKAHKPRATQSD
jgi:quercetin dioxygenase-like cupin family protein